MKNELTMVLKPLSKTELSILCAEVKEELVSSKQATKFTSADLWNIHRSRKSAAIKTRLCY